MLAASTLRPRQGTSTRLATGSQIRPSMFCRAIEAAARPCSGVPPAISTRAAAAMPEPAPHSAWQPAFSAAKVERVAMKVPIRPAVRSPRVRVSSSRPSTFAAPSTEPGTAPQAPAVGAATITPMELLTSIRAVICRMISFRSPSSIRPPACILSRKGAHWTPRMRSAYSVPARPCCTEPSSRRTISAMRANTSARSREPRAHS